MALIEELGPHARLRGLVVGEVVEIISVVAHNDTIELIVRASAGIEERLITRADLESMDVVAATRPWTFDGDGAFFRLASEARRIQMAHLFDPFVAIDASSIDPLPHQIEAVYNEMLPRLPLRFLLADDPGAGKTIMSGLYIRELIVRGDLERCLVLAPGSLVEQWQEELWTKFRVPFEIFSREMIEAARTGNPFLERRLLIARIDQIARNDDLKAKLGQAEWDLVIVDEAHKMAAHCYGNEMERTLKYRLGELIRDKTRHFLLLTATPHSGKEEDYQLFLSLVDPDRFAVTCGRADLQTVDVSDIMRRYTKDNLLTFDGKRLFPERRAITAKYDLSPLEKGLYDEVTDYVREGMNRAERLREGGDRKRGIIVGFALTGLQRRLASSPEAIYRSLVRRRNRLERRRVELERLGDRLAEAGLALGELPSGFSIADLEDFDADAFTDRELEALEDFVIDEATAASTVAELTVEIGQLGTLEKLADEVRRSGQDRKWEELRSILLGPELQGLEGSKRKLIVFTEHRDTLQYLVGRVTTLLGKPEAVVSIDGSLNRETRRDIQTRFIHDPTVQFLIATDAAGEGINLQRANLMVNYDLPWNPNRIEQRFGRIHRIGQKEVCHLWNLVANNTREGEVFERLLTKIEQMRKALGDRVYDVLGNSELNRSLRELLEEAIQYGSDPAVRSRQDQVIDQEIGDRIMRAIEEDPLESDIFTKKRSDEIRDQMERAQARRLQPGFIQAFFGEALSNFGGRITEREDGRFEITRVPGFVRSFSSQIGAPIATQYERVVFEKELIDVEGEPEGLLVAPGEPLMDALITAVIDRHGPVLTQGTVLVDPDDPSTEPKALVYVEHEIRDGQSGLRGRRVVSRRHQFVDIRSDQTVVDAGHAPYLDYRPASTDERPQLELLVAEPWLSVSLATVARNHSMAEMAGPHFAKIKRVTDERVARVRAAVEKRLAGQIAYWDQRAEELKALELKGKKPRINSGRARQRADDLEARLESRRRELDLEADLVNVPPTVVGAALVVPQGLLDSLAGKPPPSQPSVDADEVDRRAVEAVMACERRLGREPKEMDHNNPGYDIESRDSGTGMIYFIEVKGRIEGRDSVNIKARQIREAINNPERFVLAIAVIPEDDADPAVKYVRRPFSPKDQPHFAEVSRNFDLRKMLDLGEEPS